MFRKTNDLIFIIATVTLSSEAANDSSYEIQKIQTTDRYEGKSFPFIFVDRNIFEISS
jgi:hypothetical protein